MPGTCRLATDAKQSPTRQLRVAVVSRRVPPPPPPLTVSVQHYGYGSGRRRIVAGGDDGLLQKAVSFQIYIQLVESSTRSFASLHHREFAFTLQGDTYLRYNSFSSAEELKRQTVRLNPTRFEIGPMYNARVSIEAVLLVCTSHRSGQPRDKKTLRPGALQPLQRELVFDIDMTDYDEIRTCCSGKGICKRCWGFIAVAVKVLDNALKDQFGFQHRLWVYSGRRGIHCWISDEEAMVLTDDQRRAIMGWLEVIKGGRDMVKKVNVRMGARGVLHPSLQYVISVLHTSKISSLQQSCSKTTGLR